MDKKPYSKIRLSITELRRVAAMPSIRSWESLAKQFDTNRTTMEKFCRNHEITPYFLKENHEH